MTKQQIMQLVVTASVWVLLSTVAVWWLLRYGPPGPAERFEAYLKCLQKCGAARLPEGMEKPPCGDVCAGLAP